MANDFDADFSFADSADAHALVRRACHLLIPECIGVSRASSADDRRGVDFWVVTPSRRVGLDLKLRRDDYGAKRGGAVDCVVELDSHGGSGWLMKAGGADLILFAMLDTRRVAIFDAVKLRTAVVRNLSRWIANGLAREVTTQSVRGSNRWKSRAVVIPADLLQVAIDHLDDAANDGVRP